MYIIYINIHSYSMYLKKIASLSFISSCIRKTCTVTVAK